MQTTSPQRSVLFASFTVTSETHGSLQSVADSCNWFIEEADEVAALQRDAKALLSAQRAALLRTDLSTPIP